MLGSACTSEGLEGVECRKSLMTMEHLVRLGFQTRGANANLFITAHHNTIVDEIV